MLDQDIESLNGGLDGRRVREHGSAQALATDEDAELREVDRAHEANLDGERANARLFFPELPPSSSGRLIDHCP